MGFPISLKPNGQLDFSNADAVQQLTKSLLKRDFGLQIMLPPDRLCPPVPNRLNYILWIQRLIDTTISTYEAISNQSQSILGLDIGTGASCIYPLLGCTLKSNWRFFGTEENDEKSLHFAGQNVFINKLQDRISLIKIEAEESLIPLEKINLNRLDFTMCNPPFYESTLDMLTSAEAKKRPPYTACTGSESEMVTDGGEVTFISRMIDESLNLKTKVQWYTSMLGKLSSVATIHEKLKKSGIDNYAITEFIQGNKTRRWGIAWSFGPLRPSMTVARGSTSIQRSLLPFPNEYQFSLANDISNVGHHINEVISKLPLEWQWKQESYVGTGYSEKDVWSRSARRQNVIQNSKLNMGTKNMAFGFKVYAGKSSDRSPFTNVTIYWFMGHKSVLFESFCGMLKRNVISQLSSLANNY
ncbi:hypothetical protein K3495_g3679 [Podosphaera aphanis]|nr:hypothetical protein K3495_g3679 [Podosphaera aphanis]